jgi:hypothetical protein
VRVSALIGKARKMQESASGPFCDDGVLGIGGKLAEGEIDGFELVGVDGGGNLCGLPKLHAQH